MLELSAYIGFAELCQGVVKTGLCIAIPEVQWKALKAAKTLLELLKQTILINRLDVLQSLGHWARTCKSYFWDLPGHIRTSGSSLWFGSQEDAAQTQLTPVRIYISQIQDMSKAPAILVYLAFESQAPHWSRGCGLRLQRGGKYFPSPEFMTRQKTAKDMIYIDLLAGRGSPFQSRNRGQSRVWVVYVLTIHINSAKS